MGNTSSTVFHGPKSTPSSTDLSSLFWTLQISDDVVQRRGQVEADGIMAAKIGNKRISVPRPSKVFLVGVLLDEEGWIHTGVGIHNDITVQFEDGRSKQYEYLVAHGTANKDDKKFKINLSFANNRSDIYTHLADAFKRNVDYSFTPIFVGGTWLTYKSAGDVITKMEYFLGRPFKMTSPGPEETNCVHFSVAMYLFFAGKGEDQMKQLLYKMSSEIRDGKFTVLLRKLEGELDKISA